MGTPQNMNYMIKIIHIDWSYMTSMYEFVFMPYALRALCAEERLISGWADMKFQNTSFLCLCFNWFFVYLFHN